MIWDAFHLELCLIVFVINKIGCKSYWNPKDNSNVPKDGLNRKKYFRRNYVSKGFFVFKDGQRTTLVARPLSGCYNYMLTRIFKQVNVNITCLAK